MKKGGNKILSKLKFGQQSTVYVTVQTVLSKTFIKYTHDREMG